jgi:hypothetical protein
VRERARETETTGSLPLSARQRSHRQAGILQCRGVEEKRRRETLSGHSSLQREAEREG